MKISQALTPNSYEFACKSKACAPPPAGRGGSMPGGGGRPASVGRSGGTRPPSVMKVKAPLNKPAPVGRNTRTAAAPANKPYPVTMKWKKVKFDPRYEKTETVSGKYKIVMNIGDGKTKARNYELHHDGKKLAEFNTKAYAQTAAEMHAAGAGHNPQRHNVVDKRQRNKDGQLRWRHTEGPFSPNA